MSEMSLKKFDLHSHTCCSDGGLTPQALIQRAVQYGINVLAITDHDTVAGLPMAQQYIDDHQLSIQLIPGVEISTVWANQEIHLVGLQVDAHDPLLIERLDTQLAKRQARAHAIAARLKRVGIDDAYLHVASLAQGAAISRSHFAQYLINIGKVKDFSAAFKRYLGRGQCGYVPSQWVALPTAIEWIHQAGGLAVLAHPSRYGLTTKWLKRLLTDFAQGGGDAMEVAMCQQTPKERTLLGQYAQQFNLLCSVGSDFHFPSQWRELGKNLYLSERYLPVWHNWTI